VGDRKSVVPIDKACRREHCSSIFNIYVYHFEHYNCLWSVSYVFQFNTLRFHVLHFTLHQRPNYSTMLRTQLLGPHSGYVASNLFIYMAQAYRSTYHSI